MPAAARSLSRRAFLGARPAPREDAARVAAVTAACLERQGVHCRVCAERCEQGALRVVPRLGGRCDVLVESARCTGCGDCVPACPASAIDLVAVPRDA